MSIAPTVAALIKRARQRADHEKSLFVTDEEVLALLNRAHTELYDAIVQTHEYYFVAQYEFTIQGAVEAYPLPGDFYKTLGVDLHIDAERSISLKKFNFTERNKYKTTIYAPHIPASIYTYQVQGLDLTFIPKPRESRDATLWYVPLPKELVISNPQAGQTDVLDIRLAMYDDYLVIDAAINILMKEETDTSVLERERAEYMLRVVKSASNRDSNEPDRVTDAYSANFPAFNAVYPW
jgi:hypothetical protein